MKYYTTKEAAELLGITKRYITKLCASKAISGAEKKGSRWMIPETFIAEKNNRNIPKRVFNTTGICDPSEHYMVDLTQRLFEVRKLVDEGKYFTINRARQFGKTTTLHALAEYLSQDYLVISMDFQMQMSDAKFRNENSFSQAFARAFENSFRITESSKSQEYQVALKAFTEERQEAGEQFELVELFQALSNLCAAIPKKIVLMIDEVDSATNNQVFLDFLAQLRGYYINRSRFATFQSVILAGVCDIRNLKRKMRPDEEHKDNSPWNIAADFDIDMSFSTEQINGMLLDYASEHDTAIDTNLIAGEIYDYTSGYPYLVSRICQLLDEMYEAGMRDSWTHAGVLEAVRKLVRESNSLFEDMAKKVKDYPDLGTMLRDILFCGKGIPFNLGTELVSIGAMFGFLKDEDGQVAISNRIFEIWFYNLFIAQDAIDSKTYDVGQQLKGQFVTESGLDVEKILKKFVEHFTESFGNSTDTFVEENGRKLFMLYIRPLINGIGNYYIEARTRSMGRTDLIIDYLGNQYIIEMKIWRGNEYNTRGEEQLLGYLDDYHLERGYMLSFNFNKNKKPGVKELHFKNHTLIEAVV
ncbi:AAA-like domain-containing protein [Fusibacillus kribbianus]|uniref:AAA-like domain-containing protein n=1 Tax=Fusibacillus kribbianus TaxID=3044208 RepID=A0AAP4BAW7_9FIRM|nr:AAA-like domain-containing protein [Ruminococcus sp. YH-rum2234]MDI9243211.1 AAA-like domain-containing protein [Ruminococcus sp. YH-rum2234]